SFRKTASTSGTRIRYLSKGEQVTVTGQPNKYWYEVVDRNGVKGFVSTDTSYIRTTYEVPADKVDPVDNTDKAKEEVKGSTNPEALPILSFRKTASTSGTRIRYLSKGEKVTVVGQP